MDRRLKLSLMPSFRIAGFLRIIPYNNAGRVTRTRALLSVTINTAILGLMFRGFWIQFSTTNHESLTIQRKGVDYARRVSHMVSIAAGMSNQAYWYILHPTLLKSVFNRIELLSNALKNTTNYTRLNWLLGIITGATATAALLVALLWKGWRWHLIMFMYFFPNMVQVLLITQITALLEVSHCLFNRLNEEVKDSDNLYRCTQIHAVLCSVVRDVNRIYSRHLLFAITDLFINVTTQVYDMFKALADSTNPGSEPALVFCIARLMFIWSVCYFTTEVCWECDAFFRHMVEAMRARRYPCYDPTLTLYAGVKPSVAITAAGVFNITNHIITSIIATGTTYFIVLIQLE
ncbi:Gustatory Receptor [Nesidiocoris tenuis]|uniref:Gustatory receptor n=1 Tax=Nesidiocoris tenuis TaxID=355587 RepID=A0ABN7ALM9_9HEMI|nr:Gustatory Receptor [Nesidiocoris tenuis]